MKLEQQVASLELSKRLKELGVRQESYFCWQPVGKVVEGGIIEDTGTCRIVRYADQRGAYAYSVTFAAFTVAELGEMLPNPILGDYGADFYSPWSKKHPAGWSCAYWTVGPNHSATIHKQFVADTEANARAKMLVYLLEQGILPKVEGEV